MPLGRVTARSTFEAFRRTPHRSSLPGMRLAFVPEPDGGVRLACSISRKVGNAVIRNRQRRRLREVFRSELDSLQPGCYLVTLFPEAGTATYRELLDSVGNLVRRVGAAR